MVSMVSDLLNRAISGGGGGGCEARLFGVSWTRLPSKVGYETGSVPMTVGWGLLEGMMATAMVERTKEGRDKRQQQVRRMDEHTHTAESGKQWARQAGNNARHTRLVVCS
jgi:hypothetical protein